jgi:hypothetical protein
VGSSGKVWASGSAGYGEAMTVGRRVLATVTTIGAALAALVLSVTTATATAPARAAGAPAAVSPAADWAPAATAPIHPGVLTETAGGGLCTSNFVFTSGARTFLGQAAHCAGTGPETETDGCTSATGPVGTRVTVRAADGSRRAARLAYSSWVAMQAGGETDPALCAYNDFALVELDPADVTDVNPSAPFFGGPTGLATARPAPGDQVSGYGSPRPRIGAAGVAAPLRPKVGVVSDTTGGGRGHDVSTSRPGVVGDSGSGFLDARGDAFGVLTTLTTDSGQTTEGVADLAGALAYANANGGLGDVELVPGTEPFTATPPGIDPTELAGPAGPPVGG